MHNRLKKGLPFWRMIGCSAVVLAWITARYALRWGDQGPPEPWVGKNHRSAFEHADFVDGTITDMLAGCVIREATSIVSCPLGVVAKAGVGGEMCYMLIWDGRYVNVCLDVPKFRYEFWTSYNK